MTLARTDYAPSSVSPLADVRVLDMSRVYAGNALTLQLGDFGAEVIKLEQTGVGEARAIGIRTSMRCGG